MFLKQLIKNNKKFVDVVLDFHKKGYILPDTYCIDLDTFLENSIKIYESAKKNNITLYYMLKQVGRNPYLAKRLEEVGYSGAVCVDFKDVEIMMKNGLKIGNAGHLVQIPHSMLEKLIDYGVEIITVYSLEMIAKISEICVKKGKNQDIMFRVISDKSNIYDGQEAGMTAEYINDNIEYIKSLEGIRINGLTSFPCFLHNEKTNKIEKTQNVDEILIVKNILKENGINISQINLPSITSVENMEQIVSLGGTHAEPGHALSGTIPLSENTSLIQIPSYLYLSEISHHFNNKSYFYGGGYYYRGNIKYGYTANEIIEINEFNSKILIIICHQKKKLVFFHQ